MSGELSYLYKMLESQSVKIDLIHSDLTEIKIELEVIRRTGITAPRRKIVKETAAGGGIGALLMAVIVGIWEMFNKN
jgi:hypothetical protein